MTLRKLCHPLATIEPPLMGWYVVLMVALFFSLYFALGSYPLLNNNEGLYASIAKSALLNHHWIIPQLNEVAYIEKPPLLYWLLALSFSGFGLNAWAARLVTVASATLVALLLAVGIRGQIPRKVGITSALIFSSSLGIAIMARMVYFDLLFTWWVSGALLCWFNWYESRRKLTLRLGYLLCGCAVLTKGLVALIIIGGSFGAFLISSGNLRKNLSFLDPMGIVLWLAIVVPWHWAAELQHPGFLWRYLIEEHFGRFLNQREPHDYYSGSIFYYLPRILIYLFPWSLLLPLLGQGRSNRKQSSPSEQHLARLSWCWLLIPLLFFSLSRAKANYYLVVSMPALAILLALRFYSQQAGILTQRTQWEHAGNPSGMPGQDETAGDLLDDLRPLGLNPPTAHRRINFAHVGAILLWLVALILTLGTIFIPIPGLDRLSLLLLLGTICYSTLLGTVMFIGLPNPAIVIWSIASLIIPLMLTVTTYLKHHPDELSAAAIGTYLNAHAPEESSLYLYEDFEAISAISFYTARNFKMVESRSSDLFYGAQQPQSRQRFLTLSQFLQATTQNDSYLVISAKKFPAFCTSPLLAQRKFTILKRGSHLLVVHFPKAVR